MFTPEDRDGLREALVAAARADPAVTGAALFGSAAGGSAAGGSGAGGSEDRWSDIDLMLGLAAGADPAEVIAAWTARMYGEPGAVHHTDLVSGATVYRVFLLASTLQVDVAFAPAAEFGASGPRFRLLFGAAADRPPPRATDPAGLIGLGWLHALHARSSLRRDRPWQAEYMISGLRDQVIALACLRHGLPAAQGRGVDQLPAEVTAPLAAALVRAPDAAELSRAFQAATALLLAEARHADPALAARLADPLQELAGPDTPGPVS